MKKPQILNLKKCDVCKTKINLDEDNYYKCTKCNVYLCTNENCAWKGVHGEHDKELYMKGIPQLNEYCIIDYSYDS